MEEKSEFGKGLTYCLALFLCHSERNYEEYNKLKEERPELQKHLTVDVWFYGAGDHLFGLQIPENMPKDLKERLEIFQHKILTWRLPMKEENEPTLENKNWAIGEAKELIRLIDEFYGINTIKGDFQ